MRKMTGRWIVAGLLSVLGTPAMAQDGASAGAANGSAAVASSIPPQAPAEEPQPKRVTIAAGLDFATGYLFRGIFQEDRGVIAPPFVDLGLSLYEGQGALSSVSVNVGTWNSLHSGPSGSGTDGQSAWYEADYYASATLGFGRWKPGVVYTAYTSPNDVFSTVHELAAVVAFDDSESPFPLNPRAMLAFEVGGTVPLAGGLDKPAQADGGEERGTYLELGVRPSVTLVEHNRYPVSLAIPVRLGLSVKDYYEGPTGNNTFGFFDLGGVVSVPISALNGRTTWEIHGGLDVLWLGDNNRLLNGGDRVEPIGVVGFSVTY